MIFLVGILLELKLGTPDSFCLSDFARMNIQRTAILILTTAFCLAVVIARSEEEPMLEIHKTTSESQVEWNSKTKFTSATKGVMVKFSHPTYGKGILTADSAEVDMANWEIAASGRVRIQRDDMVWAGEDIRYNVKTRKMEAVHFRAGTSPAFASGKDLTGDISNQTYTATSAYITTDDIAEPTTRIRASSIKIVPGKYFEARNAVLFVGNVPMFYFPFYTQRLDGKGNQFHFVPGYRSRYGPFLKSSYEWILNEQLDGEIHADYRQKRGFGGGPDFNLHLGRWGESKVKYYALHDLTPERDNLGFDVPANRQRFKLGYDALPWTNLNIKAAIGYQSDERILHNFFEDEYRADPQPSTFLEINKTTDNFSLDFLASPRVNEFFETVERLPDLKLTGFRQQVLETPVYYESETSVGWYRRRFAITNNVVSGADYSATRADTYQQLTLPQTYFGWLNLTPRVGGRLSYYGDASGAGAAAGDDAFARGIFNTGAELTFKASQTWANTRSHWLDLDGLRHIVQPSINYIYVPRPNRFPAAAQSFDSELPSLRQLPIEFPDYNSVDSVDSQNTMRFGVRNRFQTKRDGEIGDFLYWDIYSDWRMRPRPGQTTFSDVYSDLVFRPRNWLSLESLTRYDIDTGLCRLSFHNLTLQPNETWSWGVGHLYVRDDFGTTPTALQTGNSFLTSTLFLRMNENWGFRSTHQYEVSEQWLQEQTYSIYRDLRNWTAALTFRIRDTHTTEGKDYGVAFTVSLKASPRYGLGDDAVAPSRLLGY